MQTSTALSQASWSRRRRTLTPRGAQSNAKSNATVGLLVYKAAGVQNEATPVVLIHGFGGDSDSWLFNIDELAKSRPVYALDLPGHGKSTKSLATGDLGELARSVADLLDDVGAANSHLVGHSLGAAVAFEILRESAAARRLPRGGRANRS